MGSVSGSGLPPEAGLATIDLRQLADVTVAAIGGEVDLSNVDELRRVLTEVPNVSRGLLIDLTGVTFMDSTGISLLYELSQRLRRRSQQLVVVSPPGSAPRHVLELTGFESLTTVADEMPPGEAGVRGLFDD